ncbi:AAA family ATPase [Sulfoacidibacillus ferrooxidans]|uniref:AAA+ ATPase domain-containing protein n=1 Tax=Sulfoacidibacillus ferrooxidans TaxID=2005001 RepID=A0A9X1V5U6_9BACL|nr:AAA family ATPase [Sulfoacidibacillus ferrooxidans]MCI0182061.1 hypothetical protein [Sulfoacidibacillus ferrooxidans]
MQDHVDIEANSNSLKQLITTATDHISASLFGVENAIEELFTAFLARGHILLEDVPGVGKTELAKAFAYQVGLTFRRIQCTPDMLPADILGALIFNPKTSEFQLRKGPIFSQLLLVDEINRALPRTQSALLEAMAEGQVTIDGETHMLPQPFMVIATQNPIESQGVFPLPEAQLDRFLLKTSLGYPNSEHSYHLLSYHLNLPVDLYTKKNTTPESSTNDADTYESSLKTFSPLFNTVQHVQLHEDILRYMIAIAEATHSHPDIEIGASPRGMIMMAKAARALAAVKGRNFVIPDDVKRVAPLVLFHRLVFRGFHQEQDLHPREWMMNLLESIPVPVEEGM